jgi:gluconokinase
MIIVFMGVTGAGKTTVGQRFAAATGAAFFDADDYHSPSSVAKLRNGQPLTDADRDPWLDSLADLIRRLGADHRPGVLACSALKASYRARLRAAAREAGMQIVFVHLRITSEVAAERLRERRGHFMSPDLVESQFATLEDPNDADALSFDAGLDPDTLVAQIRKALEDKPGPHASPHIIKSG